MNGGRSYRSVYTSDGRLLLKKEEAKNRVFSSECAAVMNKLLGTVTESGTASSVKLKYTVDTAGKTGTSGEDRDRLFVGYTPYLTSGIWCGYRDGTESIGKLSVSHLKIWNDVMTRMHGVLLDGLADGEIKSFDTGGLVRAEYCRDSGELFAPNCAKDPRGSRLDYGYFIKGTEPNSLCKTHILCRYDREAEALACEGCPDEFIEQIALIKIEYRSFPKQIIITDAEYVYRDLDEGIGIPEDYSLPYFYFQIPEGEFVGRSRRRKQFNSGCFIHGD
jgi:membrane carboxypeptidase/penicillin-binding protein PbpC